MCLIIDSNLVHAVFPLPSPAFSPVHNALLTGRARIVYGGQLTREYRQIRSFWRLLLQLDRQGRARQVSDNHVHAETERIRRSGLCCSDDAHILALARVGRVRLLCSEDNNLTTDFRNHRILANPRGNVYRRAEHAQLLRRHCSPRRP